MLTILVEESWFCSKSQNQISFVQDLSLGFCQDGGLVCTNLVSHPRKFLRYVRHGSIPRAESLCFG